MRRQSRFIKPRTYPHKEQLTQGWQGSQWREFCSTQKDIGIYNKRLGQSGDTSPKPGVPGSVEIHGILTKKQVNKKLVHSKVDISHLLKLSPLGYSSLRITVALPPLSLVNQRSWAHVPL